MELQTHDLAIEVQYLRFQRPQLGTQSGDTRSRYFRDTLVFCTGDDIEQLLNAFTSDRRDDTKLGKMGADRVNHGSFAGTAMLDASCSALVSLALVVPLLAVGCRRLHDIGRSGWWQLLLLTLIGTILLIVWWATQQKTNQMPTVKYRGWLERRHPDFLASLQIDGNRATLRSLLGARQPVRIVSKRLPTLRRAIATVPHWAPHPRPAAVAALLQPLTAPDGR